MDASALQELNYAQISDCAKAAGFPLHDNIDLPLFKRWQEIRRKMESGGFPLELRTGYESEFSINDPSGNKLDSHNLRYALPFEELAIVTDGNDRMEIRSPEKTVDGRYAYPRERYPTPEECVDEYFSRWKKLKSVLNDLISNENLSGHTVGYLGDHLHFSYSDIAGEDMSRFRDILRAVLTVNLQAARPLICTTGMLTAKPAEVGAYLNAILYREDGATNHSFIAERDGDNHYEIRCVFAPEDGKPVQELPHPLLFAQTLLAGSIQYAAELYFQDLHDKTATDALIREAYDISHDYSYGGREACGFGSERDGAAIHFNGLMEDLRTSPVLKASLGDDMVESLAQCANNYWQSKLRPGLYSPPADLEDVHASQIGAARTLNP